MNPKQYAKAEVGTGSALEGSVAQQDLMTRVQNARRKNELWRKEEESHPARREVQQWLTALLPHAQTEAPLSKDISAMSEAIASIVEATQEKILTESEANAITEFLVGKFVERRLERTLRTLLLTSDPCSLGISRYFNE